LGEVVINVTATSKLKREAYREVGKTPIIDQGVTFIAGYTDEEIKALPKGEYIIFGDHSEHIKYIDFAFIQGADGLKILNTVSDVPKYIYYAFQNFYQKELNYKRHWSRANKTLIPIPAPKNPKKSLEIQAKIVRILDNFDALTNSITEGLPREIELRTKQYEYYRDLLLNFPKNEVVK
jgi:type I restriction enzyme S subunit